VISKRHKIRVGDDVIAGGDDSCFRPVPKLGEDVKDKLLAYLFDRLRSTLAATGCPISDVRLGHLVSSVRRTVS